jgi:hypothetical protein
MSARSLIKNDDVAEWVRAGIDAGMPAWESMFNRALKEQQIILDTTVENLMSQMNANMDKNTRVMHDTIALQGKLFISCGILCFIMSGPEAKSKIEAKRLNRKALENGEAGFVMTRREKYFWTTVAVSGFWAVDWVLNQVVLRRFEASK